MTLIVPHELVQDVEANELIGNFSLQNGIDTLLAGTGLTPTFSNHVVLSISVNEEMAEEGEPMEIKKKVGILAVIAGLFAGGAGAQETGRTSADDDDVPRQLEEIVVVGTPGGSGISKQDASFAVTTIDALELGQALPKSTAEVFTLVPGVWAESSGGISGANIDVRGLPGGGDAPFVTISLNGAPLYGTESLSFFEHSTIFRVDETIASAEAVHGGPAAVFSNGEPGVTMNFTLRKGSEDSEGKLMYSTSDYGLQRIDGYSAGPLSDSLFYMIGGYVQSSPGIRDAQFTSEKGEQLSLQLTKYFDAGELNLWTRVTDDRGQWYLPVSLNTGNERGTFSQLGHNTRYFSIATNAAGVIQEFDFANGRGWDGSISGANLSVDLANGWELRNNTSITSGNADTYGFVTDVGAVQVADLPAGTATTVSGNVLSPTDFVQQYGYWVVTKDLQSFTNDLSLNRTFNDHDLTLGYYSARWSSDDYWALGNNVVVHNVSHGERIDGNTTCDDLTAAGAGANNCGWYRRLSASGDASTSAFYIADSWQATDALRIDVGVRHESIDVDWVRDGGDWVFAGPNNELTAFPQYPDGQIDQVVSIGTDEISYTAAINYEFRDNLGVFARFSDGHLFPHFDDLRSGNLSTASVEQIELGVKYTLDDLSLYGTLFSNRNDNFASTVGGNIGAQAFKTESTGIEVSGNAVFGGFSVSLLATLQDAEITDSTNQADIGNRVLRQPEVQARLAPSYSFAVGDWELTAYGAVQYVGDRYGQNANVVKLSSYTKVDAGIVLRDPNGFFLQVHADNLTDEDDAFTEGDPRDPNSPSNARPILGRSVQFRVGYEF